jgi:hypothetical protein
MSRIRIPGAFSGMSSLMPPGNQDTAVNHSSMYLVAIKNIGVLRIAMRAFHEAE